VTTNFSHPSRLLLFLDPGSGMGKNQDPGSGINIPDSQHWTKLKASGSVYPFQSYCVHGAERPTAYLRMLLSCLSAYRGVLLLLHVCYILWTPFQYCTSFFLGNVHRPSRYSQYSFCSYNIQHCFICRPSDSTVPTDAGIEPRTVATCALTVRRSNH
jgi:hypothetical protein